MCRYLFTFMHASPPGSVGCMHVHVTACTILMYLFIYGHMHSYASFICLRADGDARIGVMACARTQQVATDLCCYEGAQTHSHTHTHIYTHTRERKRERESERDSHTCAGCLVKVHTSVNACTPNRHTTIQKLMHIHHTHTHLSACIRWLHGR